MALDKKRIDELFLEFIAPNNSGFKYSRRIDTIVNSLPSIVWDEWDKEEMELETIATLYECLLDIEDEEISIAKAHSRAGLIIRGRLISSSRKHSRRENGKEVATYEKFYTKEYTDENINMFQEDVIVQDEEIPFIGRVFVNNIDKIVTSKNQKLYIDEGKAGFYDKGYKTPKAMQTNIRDVERKLRDKTLKYLEKTYHTSDLAIAEILSDIDTIDTILDSDHIGAEFNKHKDTPLLFDMFYDNISAASRISINKEHYSNDSISELKSNLENQKNKLINKLHKKEVELNDINSKATFNK